MTDVHTYFGLSYANYLVKHRTLLQSMPEQWQHRFVACLRELDAAFAHVDQAPGYEVTPVDWRYVNELTPAELTTAGVTVNGEAAYRYYDRDGNEVDAHVGKVAVPADEPIPHYRRARIEPNLDAATPASAPEPGTGELGELTPETLRAVDALREFDWTGFDPASLDDIVSVACTVLNESDSSLATRLDFADVLPPSTD